MSNVELELDNWIATGIQELDASNESEDWNPGFDVDRQVVYSKLGPYKKFFLRPENFTKRFYQTVYPLPVEEWECTDQVSLYDGFCTINTTINVRFQATYKYALSNLEILTELNEHIKTAYLGVTLDIVNRELLNLSDGSWVKEGLNEAEKKIAGLLSEMFILENIQSLVTCKLKASFEEFPDVHFAKESVYLSVLKKSFEFSEEQKDELFRQQQSEEKQKIEHKRLQFKQINESAELDRQKQLLHAENNKRFLKDKEKQQLEQFEIKKRIHADKLVHNRELKEMATAAELVEKEQYQIQLLKNEEQEKINLIAHKAKLKEKELAADITEYEREQKDWREVKNNIHAEELDLKHRQKQLEFDTDVGYKKRYEQQRLAMQEESYSARKNADVYLKREIELLELEKQRLALQLSIKEFKDTENKDDSAED